mgnify:CR=1 FL=1
MIQQAAEGPEAESAAILALLAAFFVLLLLLAMGLLGLIAADLTRPIRELERRATDVARGDLRRPLLPVATAGGGVRWCSGRSAGSCRRTTAAGSRPRRR